MVEQVGDNLNQLHRSWVDRITLDDQLWFQAICTSRSQGLRLQGGLPHNDGWLWKLIQLGYLDGREADRPWDASTRSMRYAAILVDRLLGALETERARVSVML